MLDTDSENFVSSFILNKDEYRADSPDLDVHVEGANLKYLEFEDDRERMSDIGVKMKFLCDELEVQPYGNEDGMWKSLYQTLETGMSSFKNLFTQSEVSTVQPLDSLPSLSDEVRVLHVEDAGVSLEKCELSCFSAKLLHPTFSPKGVLVRSGFPVKAHCEVLIYCTSTAHLTLHVYLVPCDSKIIESVQKQENHSIKIPKPRPDASLQMKNHYMLSTSCSSRIRPQKLKLRYTSQTPNFFEVYIKDAKDDFQLFLMNEEGESVWEADMRSAEYSRNLGWVGVHFVDLHRKSLIQKVKLVEPIADDLYPNISEEKYSRIKEAKTSQDKMRVIYDDILLSGGQTLKEVFLQSLRQNEPDLVAELSQL
ncbi:hypothetical protein MHYP_G00245130 [Metynnis hypsauchen]